MNWIQAVVDYLWTKDSREDIPQEAERHLGGFDGIRVVKPWQRLDRP
jgi:hypothetical protein